MTSTTPIAAATSGWFCSMPRWYMSNTGDADAPFGPPPPVSRYGSVNRFAPVMIANSVTSVVAVPYARNRHRPELRHHDAPSTEADSYNSLGTFCSAARYSRMKKPSCFQVTKTAIDGIAQCALISQDGFGASGPEHLVDQSAGAEQEQPDADHRDAGGHVRDVVGGAEEGRETGSPR